MEKTKAQVYYMLINDFNLTNITYSLNQYCDGRAEILGTFFYQLNNYCFVRACVIENRKLYEHMEFIEHYHDNDEVSLDIAMSHVYSVLQSYFVDYLNYNKENNDSVSNPYIIAITAEKKNTKYKTGARFKYLTDESLLSPQEAYEMYMDRINKILKEGKQHV